MRYLKLFYSWKRKIDVHLLRKGNQLLKSRINHKILKTKWLVVLSNQACSYERQKYFNFLKTVQISRHLIKKHTIKTLQFISKFLVLENQFEGAYLMHTHLNNWRCITRVSIPTIKMIKKSFRCWMTCAKSSFNFKILQICFSNWRLVYRNSQRSKAHQTDSYLMRNCFIKWNNCLKQYFTIPSNAQTNRFACVCKKYLLLFNLSRNYRPRQILLQLSPYLQRQSTLLELSNFYLVLRIARSKSKLIKFVFSFGFNREYSHFLVLEKRKTNLKPPFLLYLHSSKVLLHICSQYLSESIFLQMRIALSVRKNKKQSADMKKNLLNCRKYSYATIAED